MNDTQNDNYDALRAAIAPFADLVDAATALTAAKIHAAIRPDPRQLVAAEKELDKLRGSGVVDYGRPAVALEYLASYAPAQANLAARILGPALAESDGPVCIVDVDVGAGTGAVAGARAAVTAGLVSLGRPKPDVEIVAFEPSSAMAAAGGRWTREIASQLGIRLDVTWVATSDAIPDGDDGRPTWIVGLHVVHGGHHPNAWARQLHRLAVRTRAHRILLTGAHRREPLLFAIQGRMRSKLGPAPDAWDRVWPSIMDGPLAGQWFCPPLPATAATLEAIFEGTGVEPPPTRWRVGAPQVVALGLSDRVRHHGIMRAA